VWLGNGTHAERGIEILSLMSRANDFVSDSGLGGSEISQQAITNGSDVAIEAVFRLPYFSRTWVIQELAANLDVLLYCGISEISWTRFQAAVKHLKPIERLHRMLSDDTVATVRSHFDVWKLWAQGDRSETLRVYGDIFFLLNEYEKSGCSDPRDRLYALSNLSNDIHTPNRYVSTSQALVVRPAEKAIVLPVDYTKPFEEVYTQFAKSAVRWYPAEILESAALRVARQPNRSIPSWVPRWDIPKMSKVSHYPTTVVQKSLSDHEGARFDISTYFFIERSGLPGPGSSSLLRVEKCLSLDHFHTPTGSTPGALARSFFRTAGSPLFETTNTSGFGSPFWNERIAKRVAKMDFWSEVGFEDCNERDQFFSGIINAAMDSSGK
jgi:hypothetical protein